MSRLSALLDELEAYDYADAKGDLLTDGATYQKLRAMAEEMDRVLTEPLPVPPTVEDPTPGVVAFVNERAAADPQVPKPTIKDAVVMLSVIYDLPGHSQPLVVGWNTCHRCLLHTSLCKCKEGPLEPPSIQQWRVRSGHGEVKKEAEHKPKSVAAQLGLPEGDLPHDRTPTVVDSPELSEEARLSGQSILRSGPEPEFQCKSCGIEVTEANADKNDDGTWTCFGCQTQEAS